MQLVATAQVILSQIITLTEQLTDAEYTSELEVLSGNTIGKHVRHILEFYEILLKGASGSTINYDERRHDNLFETDVKATQERIKEIMLGIENMDMSRSATLEVSYCQTNQDTVKIKSSLERELAYNIEHAIHHMAIIKIAIQTVFPSIKVSENFGVAYSTVRYQKTSKS